MIKFQTDDDLSSSSSDDATKIVHATALSEEGGGCMCVRTWTFVVFCPCRFIETHVCASIATTRVCMLHSTLSIFACLDLANFAVPMFRVGRTTDGPALGLTSRRPPPPLHRLLFSFYPSLFSSIPCTYIHHTRE